MTARYVSPACERSLHANCDGVLFCRCECHERQAATLGDALPREMARVRDEVLPAYIAIGAPGAFAAAMIRADLDRAARALARGDTVAMIAVYESLRDTHT